MTTPTHAALGLLIGTVTGHPIVGMFTAVIVDSDHLVVYIRHGILKNPRLFWKTVTSVDDPYGGQRGWLHSLLVAAPLSLLVLVIAPVWGTTIVASYLLGHLALDALDSADYWPLYPSKSYVIRGPVQFFSYQELILTVTFLSTSIILS